MKVGDQFIARNGYSWEIKNCDDIQDVLCIPTGSISLCLDPKSDGNDLNDIIHWIEK